MNTIDITEMSDDEVDAVLAGKVRECRYCTAKVPPSWECCTPCAKAWCERNPYGDVDSWDDGPDPFDY